jgi:hypothetical protein
MVLHRVMWWFLLELRPLVLPNLVQSLCLVGMLKARVMVVMSSLRPVRLVLAMAAM